MAPSCLIVVYCPGSLQVALSNHGTLASPAKVVPQACAGARCCLQMHHLMSELS